MSQPAIPTNNPEKESNVSEKGREQRWFRQFIMVPFDALDYSKAEQLFSGARATLFSFFYQWFWWVVFGISMSLVAVVWSIMQAKTYLPVYAPKLAKFSMWFSINIIDPLDFSHIIFSSEGVSTDLAPQPTDLIFYLKGIESCFPDSLEKQTFLFDKRQVIVMGCRELIPNVKLEGDRYNLESILPLSLVLTVDTHKEVPRVLEGAYAILGVGKRYVIARWVDPVTGRGNAKIEDLLRGVDASKAGPEIRLYKEVLSSFLLVDIPALLFSIAKVIEREGTLSLLIKFLVDGVTLSTLLGEVLPLFLLGAVVFVLVQRFLMWLSSFIASGVWRLVDFIFKMDRYTSFSEETQRARILLYWVNGVYLAVTSLVLFLGLWFPDILGYVIDALFLTLKWWLSPFVLSTLGLIMLLLVNARRRE